MKCSLCGYRYDEERADSACQGCKMAKGCKLIRCPNCNYEEPVPPKWIKKIMDRRRKNESK